ncbi:MAG: hypothetical protein GX051_01700 [Clostridiales bacterium]|nr:hypothetical protein [Clostridiales bacterium]
MADIQQLIKSIIEQTHLNEKKALESKVYHDEPILRTASQMANYINPQYRGMKKLASGDEAYSHSPAKIFYKQAKFMEEFEEDFDYHGEFIKYYPTYRDMNDLQLRGYFSWRTAVRRGDIKKTSLSFAFVYIYELLNLVGVASPQEGFDALRNFWSAYRELDSGIDRYMRLWLSDFTVYYNLDKALLYEFSDVAFDDALCVLADSAKHTRDEVFDALNMLSSYNLGASKFYAEYPVQVKTVACAVFTKMSEYYAAKRKNTLCENLFGKPYKGSYHMFATAVFYDSLNRENFTYEVNGALKYTCVRGKWSCERCLGCREKSRKLGDMLRAVDFFMREKYAYAHKLKPVPVTKLLEGVIKKETDSCLEAEKRAEEAKIEIDISRLGDIRRAALETQEKLIIEPELDCESEPDIPAEAPVDAQPDEPDACCPVLGSAEYSLLRCLISGEDFLDTVRQSGSLLSVLADSINEAFFDTFGDTVIVFDGDKPEVLDDYRDELKEMLKL